MPIKCHMICNIKIYHIIIYDNDIENIPFL